MVQKNAMLFGNKIVSIFKKIEIQELLILLSLLGTSIRKMFKWYVAP